MSTFLKTVTNTVKHWYLPLIIGILFILLGAYIFSVPTESYVALSILFAVSFIVSGILEIVFSLQNSDELEGWGWYLAGGILDLIIGIILSLSPGLSMATLPFFVGFMLLFKSIQGLGVAFDLKHYGVMDWGYIAVTSVLGIIFSFMLVAYPVFAGISIVVFTALSFIFLGIQLISVSISLRKIKNYPNKVSRDLQDKIKALKDEYYQELKNNSTPS